MTALPFEELPTDGPQQPEAVPYDVDPVWSVCELCWAVVASLQGHAATHGLTLAPMSVSDPEPEAF